MPGPSITIFRTQGNIAEIIKIVAADRQIHTLVFQFDQFRYLRRVMGKGVHDHMKYLLDLMVKGCEQARQKEQKPIMTTVSLDPYLEDEEDRHYNLLSKDHFRKGASLFILLFIQLS